MSPKKVCVALWMLAGLSTLPSTVFAQGDCESILVPDVTVSNQDREVQLAWLKLSTFDQYQRKEASEQISGSYGGFSAGRDQSSFELNKTNYLNRENFRYSEADVRSFFHRGLTATQTDAWAQCKARSEPGVYMVVSDVSSDSAATVRVLYRSAPGRTATVTVESQGGRIGQSDRASLSMPHGSTRTFLITKNSPGQRMILVANAETPAGPENSSSAVFPIHYSAPTAPARNPVPTPSCSNPVRLSGVTSPQASAAFDGNDASVWNSGRDAPTSVSIDLGGKAFVTRLEVLVEQGDPNPMTNKIYGLGEDGRVFELGDFNGAFTRGAWGTFTVPGSYGRDLVSLRFDALSWRNWVALREVRVFGCR